MGRRGWIFSGVLHGGVLAAAVLGLPSLFKGDSDIVEESVVVSMIIEEDVAGVRRQEPDLEKEEVRVLEQESEPVVEELPEPELESVKVKPQELPPPPPEPEPIEAQAPEPPPPEPEPEPEPEYDAVEPEPLSEPEPLPEPIVEETPPEPPKAKPELKPQLKPGPPPKLLAQVPKPVVKPKSNFVSLLKSVVEEERELELEPQLKPEPAFDKLLASVSDEPALEIEEPERSQPVRAIPPALSNQIAAVIKDRVEANWSVPAGVRDAGDLVVTIRIRLGRDGVVQSAEILEANYAEDPNFRTMAESARRAVQKASPIKALRRFGDDYNEWRDVTMTFRPPV